MNTGFMPIRNGEKLGYPFVEAIASALPACDEFVVCDFGSDDSTYEVIKEMAELNKKIKVFQSQWPKKSSAGNAIAVATNQMMKEMCSGDRLLYVQADEIYHQNSAKYLIKFLNDKSHKSISMRFIHFRNSFTKYISNPTYNEALRIINKAGTFSIRDGFNFGGDIKPVRNTNVHVFHMGWCFVKNICHKHINHAALYPGHGGYEGAKRICEEMLKKGNLSADVLCKKIDRQYKFLEMAKAKLPKFVHHLFKQKIYDPHIGLQTLTDHIKNS